jgi:hypothetical protein
LSSLPLNVARRWLRSACGRDKGKLPEAEAAYRRALDIRVRALGPTNADVIETNAALAAMLRTRGQIREADSLTPLYASHR